MSNAQLRRTGYVPIGSAGADIPAAFGGGLAANASAGMSVGTGQLSLGILGALVLGSVGLYWWTRSIQGGH
jgi:hypothetical protein